MPQWASALIQVVVGVIIIVIVYYISLYAMRQDSLLASKAHEAVTNAKQETLVLDGYIDAPQIARKSFSTVNPVDPSFVPMPRSYNRMGGAQFSYAFWLYLGDTHASNVAGKDIFLRGDARKYYVKKTEEDGTPLYVKEDYAVKCPRLRFGDSFKDLVLEFNTQDDIHHAVNLTSVEHATDTTLRHNLLDLIPKKWVYITLAFEDNVPISDFENGVVVRLFVNDVLYFTHRVHSALRQNNGDLYIFPNGQDVHDCRIGNFKYFNYAVGFQEVKAAYARGRPQYQARFVGDTAGVPLYISEYNKLDLYNR